MNVKTDIVKELGTHGVVNVVVERKSRKVLGKYTIGTNIVVEDFTEDKDKILKLTVNGMDN